MNEEPLKARDEEDNKSQFMGSPPFQKIFRNLAASGYIGKCSVLRMLSQSERFPKLKSEKQETFYETIRREKW